MDVIDKLESKLDQLDRERQEIKEELELKRFRLEKVKSIIDRTERLQEEYRREDEREE